jgi:Cu+-exporting ATPase
LIVACPCALLLSQNYTHGNILRILGLNKFYLRSPDLIEDFSSINHIVLDKTGTLTQTKGSNVRYSGKILSEDLKKLIASLLNQSSHPASKLVFQYLNISDLFEVANFKEIEGKGIEGWVNDQHIKIGSAEFIGKTQTTQNNGSIVMIFIDGAVIGEFVISNKYRFGVTKLIQSLKKHFTLSLLSGDNDTELKNIEELLGKDSELYFNQSPQQKLEYIKQLQDDHQLNVMMIGDGLNDAGALKQSNIGIAVADTSNTFTPSSDGVIDGSKLSNLDSFIQFARVGKKLVLITFGFSVIYNIIGLVFAVQGILSPVIAAILMPCSSITIIFMTYGLTEWLARKYNLNRKNY